MLTVDLPDHIKELDYLREYYGNIERSIRAIFDGYLGWFDGNPTHLFSMPPKDEARQIAKLAGGDDVLREAAEKALAEGDAQWCAQLCDHLLALDEGNQEVRNLKADALGKLAESWAMGESERARIPASSPTNPSRTRPTRSPARI